MLFHRLMKSLQPLRYIPKNYVSKHTTADKSFKSLSALIAKMPKDDKEQLQPLRDQRMTRRKRTAETVPHCVFFQILGNGAPGGSRSLFLYTENARYLFNCGEGSQRLATELCPPKALAQLEHIFITNRTWQNLGGLPGMCLSIRAAGAPDVTVHGPKGCMEIYEATKNFLLLFEFDVLAHTVNDGVFSDGALSVKHIPLEYSGPAVLPIDSKYSDWDPHSVKATTVHGELINELTAAENRPPPEPIEQSVVAYLIDIKGKPGKLNMNLCVEHGVPPGPLLGKLKKGEDVTLDDGRVIKASDVVGMASPELQYLVIECPNKDFLPGLLNNTELKNLAAKPDNLKTVFHFSPDAIVRTPEYRGWMESLPSTVQHVMINDTSVGYDSTDVLAYTRKLHVISPHIFPVLDQSMPSADHNPYKDFNVPMMQAQTGVRLNCRGNFASEVDTTKKIVPIGDSVEKELSEIEDIEAVMDIAHNVSNGKGPEYPKVTFLGTGSSVPSKYRCVSAILLETEPDLFILLDCGEGTLLQLHRRFGRDRTLHILRNLKAIFVSHLHADHHLGLINLVQERDLAFSDAVERLIIVAPRKIALFLSFYHRRFEPILEHLQHAHNEHLLWSTETKTQPMYAHVKDDILRSLHLKSLVTCRAFHCANSFCVSLTTDADYRIVYTGDTRPMQGLIDIGVHGDRTPDLLIHEATMEHYMLEDAKAKKHSTFTEAIEDARKMEAAWTILTHFSQRYSKFPPFDEVENEENIAIAFDHLTVSPQNIGHVSKMYPALKKVFPEELQEMLERKEGYQYKGARGVLRQVLPREQSPTRSRKKIKISVSDLL